ncbi:MAG: hypothetical protein WD844_01190 [Thermoleophilaceae bacterium]
MRVVVLGGTRFIGRAVVEELVAHGHEPLVVHRGEHEPPDLPEVEHLHSDRPGLPGQAQGIGKFKPDAAIDCFAMTRDDADRALAALPPGIRLCVLSSCDVYRAYSSLHNGLIADAVPLRERSPVREEHFPYRGQDVPLRAEVDLDNYEKLHVEDAYLAYGGTVLRLPFVYGEHDWQRREEFVLRRVRAGREAIPTGAGTWLASRGYVRDVAGAARLAIELADAAGEIFNIAERATWPVRAWAEHIVAAAGSQARLVTVREDVLPPDLDWTSGAWQHLLIDAAKARDLLGWTETDPEVALRRSVRWHLDNPPAGADPDFAADDAALGPL